MNFRDVWMRQQAKDLVPPPHLVMQEEQRRVLIAERDKRAARVGGSLP
jgi:hypothetical protein